MYSEPGESSYSSLLEKYGYNTLLIRLIKSIATEVFKSLYNLNPIFMNQMFEVKPYHITQEIIMFYFNLSGRKSDMVKTLSKIMEPI